MLSDQEVSQQRLLKVAVFFGVAVYVIIASVLIGRTWINSSHEETANAQGLGFEVVRRDARSE